jgi:predicted DNA-binding transcriptional regulator AlpA
MIYATATQIAQHLGVAPRTVYGWIDRYPDFPEPVVKGFARRWDLEQVEEWHRGADIRPGRREGSQ